MRRATREALLDALLGVSALIILFAEAALLAAMVP